MAIELNRVQIAVDTYIFSGQFTDVATVNILSRYTSGTTYYYPAFDSKRDGKRFEHDLAHDLTRTIGFEAVFRVRATRGVSVSSYYGNYFTRGQDLLNLPTCSSDTVYTCELSVDEAVLLTQVVSFQSVLLYTAATGDRRICLHTMIIPVCNVSIAGMVVSGC